MVVHISPPLPCGLGCHGVLVVNLGTSLDLALISAAPQRTLFIPRLAGQLVGECDMQRHADG